MQFLLAPPLRIRSLLLLVPIGLLLLGTAGCGGDDSSPEASLTPGGAIATATEALETTPTARATPTAAPGETATPSPDGTAVAEAGYNGYQLFGDFRLAEAVDFPQELMMLVATGCTLCDGGPAALYRVWRNDGETYTELLVDAAIARDEDGNPIEGARLTSIAVRPTLHDIVVTVCNQCGEGPLSASSTTVYRSIDGGISWREVLETEPGDAVFARANTGDGIVLEGLSGSLSYLRGSAIEPPEGAVSLLPDTYRAGELRWLADEGSTVLDAGGRPIAKVEPGSLVGALVIDRRTGALAAVGWGIGRVVGPFEGWTVTTTGPDGKLSGFRSDTPLSPVSVLNNGAVLGGLAEADSPGGGVIGFIDPSRGALTPIHGALLEAPFGQGAPNSGEPNDLLGAVNGPFLRVTSGVNCLPIRVGTDNRSRELTCAADGTLVYDLHNQTIVGAQEWQRVRLLDGREGYTVTRYLSEE